jgi:hypothetical protein
MRARVAVAVLGALACSGGTGGGPAVAADAAPPPIDTAAGGSTTWVRTLGGLGTEWVVDVATHADGSTSLLTVIGDGGPTGTTPLDWGLVRLRPDRSLAWSRTFKGTSGLSTRLSIAASPLGNLFLAFNIACTVGESCMDLGAGQASGSVLVKFAPDGHTVWQRALPATMNVTNVAVDAAGSAAFALARGTLTDNLRFVKFRWDGAQLWDLPAPRVNAGAAEPEPWAIAFDPAGNLAVGDRLVLYSLDAGGGMRWRAPLGEGSTGGIVASIGTTALGTVVAVALFDSGTVSWAGTRATASGSDRGSLLAVAEADGSPRLGRVLSLGDGRDAAAAAVDPAGRVAILTDGPGSCDEQVERWDLAGDLLWRRALAGGCPPDARLLVSGIAVDPVSHHVRIAGGLQGTVDLGAGPVSSRGQLDDLLVDIAP